MRKIAVVGVMICLLLIAGVAVAKEVVVKAQIASIVTATDKNGDEYVRAIVNETKTISGIQVEVGVPAMFFGDKKPMADGLTAGQSIRFIGQTRYFNGRKSYNVLKVLE